MISCDADNKLTYEDVKNKYYNRFYDAPIYNEGVLGTMARPVKLLESGDPLLELIT